MLDVHRLRLLRELASRGTIAATARACALTPSAVSQQLAILQREVGAPLYHRDGRTLVLTEAARVLVAHTERILAAMEDARAGVAQVSGGVSGVVRLGAFPTAASSLVPPAIVACRAEHRELRVLLEERETADGIAALKAGRLDLLLVYEFDLLPRIDDAGVELTPLLTEPLHAAVPPALDLPRGPLRLDSLSEHPWIAPASDIALRRALDRACGLAGFAPRLDYTSDDYTVILALVRAGLGVSVVPRLATEGLTPDVRLLSITEPELTRSVSVAVRSGSASAPRIAVLIAALREAARGLGEHTS
ncbi:LysR family transcriptional regulator [Saccharopolyspora erythraea]|uniref:LysR family transcriptional regulator n=1 Tax=Saccharopolyspora erythraea TaxID=1836 RepID=UPI001BAC9AE6|nr:LysR family transcriptional regulator [Saccharopolyspora erythraea]QUH02257.1 LysR family transcriptional regulator [Saccharopolyspora erythraea]